MFSATALLHSAMTLLHSAMTLLFSIVQYLRVPMVLHPSHSLLLVYADKHLYEKYLNNEQYENTSNQLGY